MKSKPVLRALLLILCTAALCISAIGAGAEAPPPEYITQLSNGNIRYDDGRIAFEAPAEVEIQLPFISLNGNWSITFRMRHNDELDAAIAAKMPNSRPTDVLTDPITIGQIGTGTYTTASMFYGADIRDPETLNQIVYSRAVAQDEIRPGQEADCGIVTINGRTAYYNWTEGLSIMLPDTRRSQYYFALDDERYILFQTNDEHNSTYRNALQTILETLEIRGGEASAETQVPIVTEMPVPTEEAVITEAPVVTEPLTPTPPPTLPPAPETGKSGSLSDAEQQRVFSILSGLEWHSSSGAGAWEGRLWIDGQGGFIGSYYDADAEEVYKVSFSGTLGGLHRISRTAYRLTVVSAATIQTPGDSAEGDDGERIIYLDTVFPAGSELILTFPGTPTEEIPETVRGLIGGTYWEWDDYSRFYTLSRAEDGWGFFAENTGTSPLNPDDLPGIAGEDNPVITAVPDITPSPEITVTPEVTATTEATATPEITVTPEITATPEITPTPEITATPEPTEVPTEAPPVLFPVDGKPGYLHVPVASVNATSYIKGKDPTAYAPASMIDGNETTAYQFSLKETNLKEAYIYVDFSSPVAVDELWIKNGFWKITDGKDQYTRNCRVKKMRVDFWYAGGSGYEDQMTVKLKDDKARRDWTVISLGHRTDVTCVRLRIDEVYRGSKYKNDVCISEIMFIQEENR